MHGLMDSFVSHTDTESPEGVIGYSEFKALWAHLHLGLPAPESAVRASEHIGIASIVRRGFMFYRDHAMGPWSCSSSSH